MNSGTSRSIFANLGLRIGILLLLCQGCNDVIPNTVETLRRTTSPDGHLDAIHNRIDTHGGATVGYIHEIYIVPKGEAAQGTPVVELRHLIAPVEFEWQGEDMLIIAYERGDSYDRMRFWEGDVAGRRYRVEVALENRETK